MRLLRGRKVVREIDGLVEEMRTADVRIGRLNLVTQDGEPIVVLIGLGPRADDLNRAFDSLCPDPTIAASFDPPVKLWP